LYLKRTEFQENKVQINNINLTTVFTEELLTGNSRKILLE